MSETAYEELKRSWFSDMSGKENCSSVRKADLSTDTFPLSDKLILLPDKCEPSCNYNLKSCQVSVSKTDYTEVHQSDESSKVAETAKTGTEQKAENRSCKKRKR